jgi:hypothetical protein
MKGFIIWAGSSFFNSGQIDVVIAYKLFMPLNLNEKIAG